MAFDAHKNFAISTVVTAPSPATSGTTLVVTTGEGSRFPAVPFNATVWPASQIPTPGTAEVVRVTARTSDTLTITRAQESSTARAIVAGDLIAASITVKTITDLEDGTNFTTLAASAGVSVGTSVGFTGSPATLLHQLMPATSDGADTHGAQLVGGGAATSDRGAWVTVKGNEWSSSGGGLDLAIGNVSTAALNFYTGATTLRGRIHPAGGFSWGGNTVDTGGSALFIAAAGATWTPGQQFTRISNGWVETGQAVTTAIAHVTFYNPNGPVGSISTSASATAYNTSSDARLKRDRGRLTETDVLRGTVVHAFDWLTDGTPGRGVFAQDAIAVAPFAVTPGTDDRDAEGRLTQPWAVDYAKYVPDLIVGWQAHDAQVTALETRVAALEALVAALTPPPP